MLRSCDRFLLSWSSSGAELGFDVPSQLGRVAELHEQMLQAEVAEVEDRDAGTGLAQ